MENEDNRLELLGNNYSCNIMLYTLPFASNIALSKTVRERMAIIWASLADTR